MTLKEHFLWWFAIKTYKGSPWVSGNRFQRWWYGTNGKLLDWLIHNTLSDIHTAIRDAEKAKNLSPAWKCSAKEWKAKHYAMAGFHWSYVHDTSKETDVLRAEIREVLEIAKDASRTVWAWKESHDDLLVAYNTVYKEASDWERAYDEIQAKYESLVDTLTQEIVFFPDEAE